MEDIEQEPEEIPMEDVLAEIRQILSAEVKEDKKDTIEKIEPVFVMHEETAEKINEKKEIKKEFSSVVLEKEEIFILTPAMRCDIPVAKALSQNVQKQTQKVLDKLQKGNTQADTTDSLSPELITWLNKNLPDLIERTVKERFS